MAEDEQSSSIWGIEGAPSFFLVKNVPSGEEALEKCEKLIREYLGSSTTSKWLTSDECLELPTSSIAKSDVFVFPEFSGAAFEKLRNLKTALLLGTSALTRCLTHKEAIPSTPLPWIFNTAMNGLVVTLSGFKEADKKRYSDLVAFMGGLCLPVLPETCTHLVCNTVFSTKYEAAVLQGIPVMQQQWIEEVWARNASAFTSATDPQFDVFRLPVFYNLNVASTLLSNDERVQVERLVTENGGVYHKTFKPRVVNLLVLNENGKNSDKFKAAVRNKKICVQPKWIVDSVAQGFALPFGDYEISSEVRVSTPNKDAVQNPEFSVSHIQGAGNSTVNESLISVRSRNLSVVSELQEAAAAASPKPSAPSLPDNDYYKEAMQNLDVTRAKRAGAFLDGCNVFFSGFTALEVGKLNKVISLSGATRYEELHENVTHVIVGWREEKELKAFQDMNKGIFFVKFDWLRDSLEAGHVVCEDDYCYEVAATASRIVLLEQPSPASKRNIAAMNSSFKKPFPKNDHLGELSKKPVASSTPLDAEGAEDYEIPRNNLLNRYLQSTAASMEAVERTAPEKGNKENKRHTHPHQESRLMQTTFCSELETDEYEQLNFFNGKKFAIQDVDGETEFTQLLSDIQNFGGVVVEKAFRGQVDFVVTSPGRKDHFRPHAKPREVVTTWWVEDVIAARQEVPVAYYHRVIEVRDDTVLRGITCTISTYGGVERLFLTQVAQAMGATASEKYEKRKTPVLVCERAEGMKYKGALTWGFPVVTKEWLLDSYAKGHLYKLQDYLVGESMLSNAFFAEIDERGIHRGTEPPVTPAPHDNSSVIHIQSESPFSQVPPSPMVAVGGGKTLPGKRKSDDEDTFVKSIEKRLRTNDHLALLPNNHGSPSVNNRVKALRSESKSSSSPTTPISQHVREMGHEFGYDTPRRKQLYEVLKETHHQTPSTPHTPAVMKMPPVKLHPDPEATPGRQWDTLLKFSGILGKDEKKNKGAATGTTQQAKKARSPTTPLSEIKRRFWQQTLGDDFVYNNNSTMMNINSQQLVVQRKGDEDTTLNVQGEEEGGGGTTSTTSRAAEGAANSPTLKGLTDFISKRKSEPKKAVDNLETCPLECGAAPSEQKDTEIMVGWAEPGERVPFKTPPPARTAEKAPPQPHRYFLASGVEVDAEMVRTVEELGGEVQKKSEYDARCTHVLCHKLGRVEKVLCAMAAGKWIVAAQYVEDSGRAKEFLDEELYEWANPKSRISTAAFSDIENTLAQAAYAWRRRIQDKSSDKYRTGAFHGFRVLLWSKTAGFRRIIEAGGGQCLDVGSSFRANAEVAKTATHCFMEKKQKFPADNLKFCQEHQIVTKDISFLNEYLLASVAKD